jgi:hypothetical protein
MRPASFSFMIFFKISGFLRCSLTACNTGEVGCGEWMIELFIGSHEKSSNRTNSVFGQCCGSGMFNPDPDFYPSRISKPHPTTVKKRNGRKKIVLPLVFCSHKYHKIGDNFLKTGKEKIYANLQRILVLFIQKFVTQLSKWVWNPGSGKNLFQISDPGVKKASDPGSGPATLVLHLGIICGSGSELLSKFYYVPM